MNIVTSNITKKITVPSGTAIFLKMCVSLDPVVEFVHNRLHNAGGKLHVKVKEVNNERYNEETGCNSQELKHKLKNELGYFIHV